MTDATANNLQRLHDLLSEQATAGLSDSDQLELHRLLVDNATLQRAGSELAAAAVDLALAPPNGTPMPESVRRTALMKSTMEAEPEAEIQPVVYSLAEEGISARGKATPIEKEPRASARPVPNFGADAQLAEPTLLPESSGRMGWLVAAVMIGVGGLMYAAGRSAVTKKEHTPAAANIVKAAANPCDQLKADSDALTLQWAADDPTVAGVSGQVSFSVNSQQGCMTFASLPKIEKGQAVYQLWVLDADRQGPPVDCGVFEVTDDSPTSQFAFTPKLKITRPVVFAITHEAPGGVVTSTKQPIIVAKLGS